MKTAFSILFSRLVVTVFAQSGGYSSALMDQVDRTFAEQGPCSAGFQLETLKNQYTK